MKAVVWGGAEYISSYMLKELQSGGHEVLVVDELSTGYREVVGDLELWAWHADPAY